MTDSKSKYIKTAFKRYKENKRILREMAFDGVRGIDYTKGNTGKGARTGHENALVSYLDEKAAIEKQVAIVDRVLWFYELDNDTAKIDYIKSRWVKGLPLYRVAMDCYIANGTAVTWGKDVLALAARAADIFDLWG